MHVCAFSRHFHAHLRIESLQNMDMLSFLLFVGLLGAAVLSPMVAAGMVYVAPKPRPSPLANWLGLTISGELGVAFPLYALFIGLTGPARSSFYYLAYVFVAAAPTLAFLAAREHLHRLRGRTAAASRTGWACLGMAALVAVALIPWLLGAPLPPGGGRSVMRFTFAGDIRDYAWVVLPLTVALEIEAWLLSKRWDARARLGAIGVAVLVAGAILLLPPSRWNARNMPKQERVPLRKQAEAIDAKRNAALAEIAAGHMPALLPDPCPAGTTPESWRAWQQFNRTPKDFSEVLSQANAWQNQEAIALWHAGAALNETPRIRGINATANLPGISLSGPRFRAIFARLEDEDERWFSPWFHRGQRPIPGEAREIIHPSAASESWDVDATLILLRETPSYSLQDTTNLGSLLGMLWVWSYREQAFICGGEARIQHAGMRGSFRDPQAPTFRDSILMHAVAQALGALHAIDRKQPAPATPSLLTPATQTSE
jgi:hypothetical protein